MRTISKQMASRINILQMMKICTEQWMLNTYKKPWNITKKENRQNNNSDVKWIWCFIHLSLFTLLSIDMCTSTYYDSFSFWIYILHTCVCIILYIHRLSRHRLNSEVKWKKEKNMCSNKIQNFCGNWWLTAVWMYFLVYNWSKIEW